MAEITRKAQKVFAGGVSPSGNIAVYGSKLAGTVNYSSDIDVIQNERWLTGLFGAVSPDKAPYLQDLNAIFYVVTAQLAYLFQAGVAEWNASTEYFANKSFVVYNGVIYRAKANSTNIKPTVTTNWENYWETEERWGRFTGDVYRQTDIWNTILKGVSYDENVVSQIGGYAQGVILNFDLNNNTYKIRSLVNNNNHTPTPSNIRVSTSQSGTFYWELLPYNFAPGMVLPFAGSIVPKGWLLCDGSAISRTNYAFLFAIIGTTYGQGNGSSTFNLPNLTGGRFVEGDSIAGTYKDAGLPNIKGNFWTGGGSGLMNGNGAFTRISGTPNTTVAGSTGYSDLNLSFNANDGSVQSGIYKDNVTTVQPKSLTMRYIIKY